MNSSGQVLMTGALELEAMSIEVSSLPAGQYYLHIENLDSSSVIKFQKF